MRECVHACLRARVRACVVSVCLCVGVSVCLCVRTRERVHVHLKAPAALADWRPDADRSSSWIRDKLNRFCVDGLVGLL